MLSAILIAATAAVYRGAMHVLSKGEPGSLANGLYRALGGGGPGEPEDKK